MYNGIKYVNCKNTSQRLSLCNMLDAKRDKHMSHIHIYYRWNLLQNPMNDQGRFLKSCIIFKNMWF